MLTLIDAAKNGNLALVEEFLRSSRNININCRDKASGGTPLFWAANGGHAEVVQLLLNKGADIETSVKWHFTPLLGAVDRKHFKTAQLLLSRNADVNAQSQKGDTALHLAAFRGSYHLCQLLVSYGADKTILNNNGKTAEQEAEGAGHFAITTLLQPATSQRAVYRSSSLPLAYPPRAALMFGSRRVPSESDETQVAGSHTRGSLRKELLRSSMVLDNEGAVDIWNKTNMVKSHSMIQLYGNGRVLPPTHDGVRSGRGSPPVVLVSPQATGMTAREELVPMKGPVSPELEKQVCEESAPGQGVGINAQHWNLGHVCQGLDTNMKPAVGTRWREQTPLQNRSQNVEKIHGARAIASGISDQPANATSGRPGRGMGVYVDCDRLLVIIDNLEAKIAALTKDNDLLRGLVRTLESMMDFSTTTDASSEDSQQDSHICSFGALCHLSEQDYKSSLDENVSCKHNSLQTCPVSPLPGNESYKSVAIASTDEHQSMRKHTLRHVPSLVTEVNPNHISSDHCLYPLSQPVHPPSSDGSEELMQKSISSFKMPSCHDQVTLPLKGGGLKALPIVAASEFVSACWSALNASYLSELPQQALQVMRTMSGNVNHFLDRTRQALRDFGDCESYLRQDTEFHRDTFDPSQDVCLGEKRNQAESPDGHVSATILCQTAGTPCMLEVVFVPDHEIDECSPSWLKDREFCNQDCVPQHRHINLPMATWHSRVRSGDKLTQDLSVCLDLDTDARGSLHCAVYPRYQLSLLELFEHRQSTEAQSKDGTPGNEACLLRIILQLLLAVEHLQEWGVAHRDIQPRHVHIMEDMRVNLGGLWYSEALLDDTGSVRHFDDIGQIKAGNHLATAPELVHYTIHGPPKIWEHRVTLRTVYGSSDLFAVAGTLCSLLHRGARPELGPLDDATELLSSLPDWLSPNLCSLLEEMLNSSPEKRPPIKAAALRIAMMLFGPHAQEVKGREDCEVWLTSHTLRLLLTAPRTQTPPHQDRTPTCTDNLAVLDWSLCRDYLLGVTPLQLWQLHQKYHGTGEGT